MAVESKHKFTYEHYTQLPEGLRFELLDGDFFRMTPAPTTRHQWISRELQFALELYLRETRWGLLFDAPIDVKLSEHDVLQPDIVVLARGRRSIIKPKFLQGCPDLVVEILSPATEKRDRGVKRSTYSRYGAQELWLVDPAANTIEVHVASQHAELECWKTFGVDQRLQSKLLPNLSLELGPIFSAPDD